MPVEYKTHLHYLAAEADAIAAANGFDTPTWDNLPVKLMLVCTELDEARDYVYGTAADPIEAELADAAIRILSILHSIWGPDWHWRPRSKAATLRPAARYQPIEYILWRPLAHVCKAVERWRYNHTDDTRGYLELALSELWALALIIGSDLEIEIEMKLAKNRTRAKLHGKARSDA